MVLPLLVVAALSITADGQPAGQPGEKCCDSKVVGGIEYTLTGQMNTQAYQCLNDCVYQKTGETGMRYCFAMGDEKVECQDEEGRPTPPAGGGEGATQGPGGATQAPGGATQGQGGATQGQGGATQGQGCKCGLKKTSRIVGGQETEVNEYPWMAALASKQERFYCGGTLVASEWVLTAAHCLFKDKQLTVLTPASEIIIVLGEHDINSATESIIPRKVVEVTKYIGHPDFNTQTYDNDIAMIKLAEAVDLTVYTPACLANTGDDFTGKKAWVYGWGALSFNTGDYPDTLMEVEVSIVSDSVCQTAVNDLGWIITNGMLCAGGVEGLDSCQGDSGGPLTVDVSGQHTLVGDVSYGDGCGKANRYGVYAETAVFRAWIDTTVAEDGGATYCPA